MLEYSTLVEKISNLLIVYYYFDRVKVGGDDTCLDYYYICYNEDQYLKECIEKGIKSEFSNVDCSNQLYTILNFHCDPNSVARLPREGHFFDSDSCKLRLWLYEKIVPFYNKENHLNYIKTHWNQKRVTNFADYKFDFNVAEKLETDECFKVSVEIVSIDIKKTYKNSVSLNIFDKEINYIKIKSFLLHLAN